MPFLVKVSILISPKPKKDDDVYRLPEFGDRFIDSTIAALAEVRSEIVRMSETAVEMFQNTISCLENRDAKKLSRWTQIEGFLDAMRREITTYLTRIYQGVVNESEAKEISSLMRMTNNLERIGDSVENIAQLMERFIENNMQFTPKAKEDVKKISIQVSDFLNLVTQGIKDSNKDVLKKAGEIEDSIDSMREEMRQDHIARLRTGECSIDPGLLFIDMLSNFEKMGDYCFNIAQAVAGVK
jgi:phosphate:Na+ symporter